MYLLLSVIGVFLTIFLFFFGLIRIVTANRRTLLERVDKYTKEKKNYVDSAYAKGMESKGKGGLKPLFEQTSKIFASKGYSKTIELELIKADIPLKGEEFVLINILTGAIPGFLIFILSQNFITGLLVGLICLLIPRFLLKRAKNKRYKRFNGQIGDALVIMGNSLRAGFSFLQSMEMVSKEMPSPIADEFGRAIREMNLGTPTEEALLNITNRIESEDIDLVITAVLIQRQTGGNLAEVLDNISQTIRERIRIKGEIKTLTAQGRISGIIVGLLPFALTIILFLINPQYIKTLFSSLLGFILLGAGLISQTIGLLLVKKIVDIEV